MTNNRSVRGNVNTSYSAQKIINEMNRQSMRASHNNKNGKGIQQAISNNRLAVLGRNIKPLVIK